MIRVLHIFGVMNRGGAELRTMDLLRRSTPDVEFHFCVLSGLAGSLDDELRSLGAYVHYCRLDWLFPFRFIRLLKERQITAVHSHVHMFSGLILGFARMCGVQTRIAHFRTSHDGHPSSLRRAVQRAAGRVLIDLFATRIVGVSAATLREAWSIEWRTDPRCIVIYNGLSSTPAVDAGDSVPTLSLAGSPLLVHVGRFDAPKNHLRLINIFERFHRLHPSSVLVLVGRGGNEYERRARELVSALKLEQKVMFLGERADVRRVLRAAQLMIFPSKWEGLPGAVLEAAAEGLPVLAADLGVLEEIKKHLPTLRLLSLQSTDMEWAEAAQQMIDDSVAQSRREKAIEAFKSSPFTVEAAWDAMFKIWRDG